MSATPYGYRIVGDCSGQRRLIDHAAAFAAYARCDAKAEAEREAYLSAFTFGGDFREYLARTGSTRGFAGPCGAPMLSWDIDREGDLPRAQADAGRLATAIAERYGLAGDALLVFFSGSKGFHVGLPCSPWNPSPSADFNRIARRFCEGLAQGVGLEIDVGTYAKVQAFRAPNSRHPRTDLYKRQLPLRDVLHLDTADVLAHAREPAPFDIPAPTADDAHADKLVADWEDAAAQVRAEAKAKATRQATGNGAPALNRLTLDLIRNGAAVVVGDRHRLLFSAAADLREFGCPPALAHALLTESGLDSGLSLWDVKRQIDCGLEHEEEQP